jgi:hypothetical protein
MITDRQALDIIFQAIIAEDVVKLNLEELDAVSELYWYNDPDVEFVEIDYTLEAGPGLHGVNTEEEMMETYTC